MQCYSFGHLATKRVCANIMTIMYTEDEQYEEYLSWRDDMDSVERYLDRIESQLDDEIERYNQSGIES